jgi:uncharacterized membrane protein YdjX (TVP38/TMEM64 family)
MTSTMRGSGIGLAFTLLVVGGMIAVCAVLLAPHLVYGGVRRALRRRRLRRLSESRRVTRRAEPCIG